MPTILLLGPICSGKNTVADYLVQEEAFVRVRIASSGWASTSARADNDSDDCLTFSTAEGFLDYATLYWRKNFVTCDRMSRKDLDGFVKRPWVLLVGCEARTAWRWKRRNEICSAAGGSTITLETFLERDDMDMFGMPDSSAATGRKKPASVQTLHIPNGMTASTVALPNPPPPSPDLAQRTLPTFQSTHSQSSPHTSTNGQHKHGQDPLSPLLRMCNLHINTSAYPSKQDFFSHLRNLDLTREDRMRPGWDKYFMTLAGLASLRSNCMKRRVGAVLVCSKRVISTGYNGTPRGMRNCNEGGCARCNSTSVAAKSGSASAAVTPIKSGVGLDECLCLHAEENALLEAGRDRAEGGVLYCNTCPCLRCAVKICQTGIREVCYSQAYSMDELSASIFKEAGVIMRQIETLD